MDIIVIGASAGGIDALTRLCEDLPADLPAAVFVVQHLAPSSTSVLPRLLDRAGPLPASSPADGQAFERGHIYIAPVDHHLLLRDGRMLVRRGPQENRTRPAINALFRSAALACGARTIGVVLTGLLDDGTDGLNAIKGAGGITVVQDPADAAWPSMPRNAVERDHADHIAPLARLGALLASLAGTEAGPTIPLPEVFGVEDRIAGQETADLGTIEAPGHASRFSCPSCAGVLNEIVTDAVLRYRCQIGHAFTPPGLADAHRDELERAFDIAVRTHRDRIRLLARMADHAHENGFVRSGERWSAARREAEGLIAVLEKAALVLHGSLKAGD